MTKARQAQSPNGWHFCTPTHPDCHHLPLVRMRVKSVTRLLRPVQVTDPEQNEISCLSKPMSV